MIRLIRTIQCPSHPILRFTHYLTSVNGTYGTYPPNEKWGVGSKRGANAKRLAAAKDVSWGPYTSPDVYDIAFSYRDFESEVSFLLEAYSLHSKQPLHHYLDVGCGPARHAMLLAQVAGINCIGIDTSEEMIEYARQRAQECGISKHVWLMQEDMANPQGFKGIINDGPINLAAIMIGTLSHCLTNESALQCFTNIAE